MKLAIIFCLFGAAIADLRQASQPKQAYKLKQQGGGRGAKNFAVGTGSKVDGNTDGQAKGKVLYMEPSIFGYGGLANQRKKNYDNFLRSNIDNEQDNRNFNNEVGKDHLPFRTYDSATIASYPYKGTKAQGAADSLQVNIPPVATVLRALPGEPKLTPLRWNNPHASEIEVNLWIMCSDPPTIVPVKKPACSGEGNQNNIIEWAIPSDFNTVAWNNCPSTACFKGCNNPGDCVLQTYAHSVETRQYSNAVPIIIPQNQGNWNGRKLAYQAVPKDANEAKNFKWPSNFNLLSMVKGTKTQPPPRSGNQAGVTINNVEICASAEREGISEQGDAVAYVKLGNAGQTAKQLNAGTINLYLCKNTDAERAAEQLVDQVVFTITSSATGTGTFSPAGSKIENYTPFEMSSENQFDGAAVKKITAKITPYSGTPVTIVKLLDLRGNGKRWRFRRHLASVCSVNSLPKAFPDPWMDLSKLKRETCLSAQDPNSNYAKTQIQAAVLHSDVANHAYQNSDYSPYSGQQHGEISRNLQAAAVVHMTSGNRGELGKNAIPKAQKQTLKALNNAVNNIYKNYEKVANKVIDTLTKTGGTNTAAMGVQQLGTSFRSAEKGATSTKRLKTTTYVPSFDAAGYNMNTIQNAIASRTGGSKAKYKDLLSTPKPNTGKQYIEIYTATMNQMLPAFKAAEALGITYMESVKMVPCSQIQDRQLKLMSTINNRHATACCTGSLQNTQPGGCGATLSQKTQFRKRNAAGSFDGGLYSAREFLLNRYRTLYNCPRACMHPITQQKTADSGLVAAVTRSSTGTCVNYLSAQGCTTTRNNAYTDCRPCAGIFNNVAPASFASDFQIGPVDGNLGKMVSRLNSAPSYEPLGNVLNAGGEDLIFDDTAQCHKPSRVYCPGSDLDYEREVNAGRCRESPSEKLIGICDDGPCDNDESSQACVVAKAKCEVDPETGSTCVPGNENDPCINCVRRTTTAYVNTTNETAQETAATTASLATTSTNDLRGPAATEIVDDSTQNCLHIVVIGVFLIVGSLRFV